MRECLSSVLLPKKLLFSVILFTTFIIHLFLKFPKLPFSQVFSEHSIIYNFP